MRPANSGGEGERLRFPASSRFKSAGAGEYTGGRWWGPKRKRGGLESGGCGSVVVNAEGVSGVVYKVGEGNTDVGGEGRGR